MKNFLLVMSLFLVGSYSGVIAGENVIGKAKGVEGINIEIADDILIAYSDDSNDPLKFIKVINESGQVVAEKRCSGTQCEINLSHLSTGTYLGVVYSLYDQLSQYFFLY